MKKHQNYTLPELSKLQHVRAKKSKMSSLPRNFEINEKMFHL